MKYVNNKKLTPRVVQLLEHFASDRAKEPDKVGVTTITGTPAFQRQLMMKHFDEIEVELADTHDMAFGNLIHSALELIDFDQEPGTIIMKENPVQLVYDDMTVRGIFDRLYIKNGVGHILDFKTIPVFKAKKPQDMVEYFIQLNIYALMIKKMMGITVVSGTLLPVYKDWRKSEKKAVNKTGPKEGQLQYPWYPECRFDEIEVQMKPLEEVEEYLLKKVEEHRQANKLGLQTAICDVSVRWGDNRCKDYCNVKKFCPYAQKKGY